MRIPAGVTKETRVVTNVQEICVHPRIKRIKQLEFPCGATHMVVWSHPSRRDFLEATVYRSQRPGEHDNIIAHVESHPSPIFVKHKEGFKTALEAAQWTLQWQ